MISAEQPRTAGSAKTLSVVGQILAAPNASPGQQLQAMGWQFVVCGVGDFPDVPLETHHLCQPATANPLPDAARRKICSTRNDFSRTTANGWLGQDVVGCRAGSGCDAGITRPAVSGNGFAVIGFRGRCLSAAPSRRSAQPCQPATANRLPEAARRKICSTRNDFSRTTANGWFGQDVVGCRADRKSVV